eukprot:gene25783-biopygen20271
MDFAVPRAVTLVNVTLVNFVVPRARCCHKVTVRLCDKAEKLGLIEFLQADQDQADFVSCINPFGVRIKPNGKARILVDLSITRGTQSDMEFWDKALEMEWHEPVGVHESMLARKDGHMDSKAFKVHMYTDASKLSQAIRVFQGPEGVSSGKQGIFADNKTDLEYADCRTLTRM